jgi:hypothetical protein
MQWKKVERIILSELTIATGLNCVSLFSDEYEFECYKGKSLSFNPVHQAVLITILCLTSSYALIR